MSDRPAKNDKAQTYIPFVGGPMDGLAYPANVVPTTLVFPDSSGGLHWYKGRTEPAINNSETQRHYFLDYIGKSFTHEPPEAKV